MSDKTKDMEKWIAEIRPQIDALMHAVDRNPEACMTGIIFCMNPPCLIHLATVDNQGDDLIRLHLVLSSLVAEMQETKEASRLPFSEIKSTLIPGGGDVLKVADELAEKVLTAMDESSIISVQSLAQQYLTLRHPQQPENPDASKNS